jgi:hypothetical protein
MIETSSTLTKATPLMSQHAYEPTAVTDALPTEIFIVHDCNSANAPPAGTIPPPTD